MNREQYDQMTRQETEEYNQMLDERNKLRDRGGREEEPFVLPRSIADIPKPPNQYAFVDIAKQLVSSLIRGAEDNVAEAQDLLDRIQVLGEEIHKHVTEHAQLLDDASARTKAYGERVLEAHREYLNGGSHENPSP